MEKDIEKTRVLFVYPKYPDGQREVLALFPDQKERAQYTGFGKPLYIPIGCYAHIGQHASADRSFMRRVRATPEQYGPLFKELESIGYNLQVLNENPHK